MSIPLARRALAEAVGSAALAAVVIGSGIAAQRLSPGQTGLELLENALATGAGLLVLITAWAEVSGAHFNPAVSVAEALTGRLAWREVPSYVLAQVVGCSVGAVVANLMFAGRPLSISHHARASAAHLFAEGVATLGLVLVIQLLAPSSRARQIPAAVAAYITAAYFFCSSTSFANPAITVARSLSNSFAGIAPSSVAPFVVVQLLGALAAVALGRAMLGRTAAPTSAGVAP